MDTERRSSREPLAEYQKKRDFRVTGEPRASRARSRREKEPIFVVQMHDATRLHYDFRLEHGGVLWSWAVPKGPSLDPRARHLAARTEDHPLDYASFEGVIPKGEYGGGPVLVWDRGTWTPDGDPEAAMAKGHLRFELHGEKLSGAFHLVRLKPQQGEKESWLLFKSKDASARPGSDIVSERPESVSSGRSIADVREGRRAGRARAPGKEAQVSVADALSAMSLGFEITHPDKVLYPDDGITKGDVMGYLAFVSERMLPFVRGRPLMLLRCPEGRSGECFYQKHAGRGLPAPIHRVHIEEKTARGESIFVDDVAGLVALGQMSVLEIHTWMSRAAQPERPDQLVLDVDPDESLPFAQTIDAALALRAIFSELGLTSFVKTTGGKGLHVVVPLVAKHDWRTHEGFALAVARRLASARPDRFVITMSKAARRGKIFLDYLRNARGATAVAPYSPRMRDGATVAMPVSWSALERGLDPRAFTIRSVVAAGLPKQDPWRGYFEAEGVIDARLLAKL